MLCMLKNVSSYTSKSATDCATYCNKLTVWLRCDNLSITSHLQNEIAYENRAISMAEYRVCDETIWQGMTPIVSAIEV